MLTPFSYRSSALVLALIASGWMLPSHSATAAASFMPIQGWTVGSTELASARGLKGVKLPCVISAEYDNGYVVRFSGGGNQMLALAIDFRQNVFTQGQKYNAVLTVGEGYLKQATPTAFAPSILIFNLREYSDIYSVLKSAKSFSLDVEGNSFSFSLQQMANNLGSLESCYTTGNAAPIQSVSAPSAVTAAPVQIAPLQNELPRSFNDIMKAPSNDGVNTVHAGPADITPLPARFDNVTPREGRVSRAPSTASIWNAKAGEELRSVLSRWSNAAGYDLEWQASDTGRVVQDIAVKGRFEDAVSQLLAENRAANGVTGQFDDGRSAVRSPAGLTVSEWRAGAGSDLRMVLDGWAQSADAQIIWKTSSKLPAVKNAVTQSGSFENAVQTLLDQYADDSRRPVAQLNIDPKTQKRTLLLDIENAS
jgi:hypothetical protein